MNEHYLLDTNTVSAILKNESDVVRRLTLASTIALPVIVIGELFYGAYHSDRVAENLAIFDAIASNNLVLSCDVATARIYGSIKNALRLKGQPIPENDMWIAAPRHPARPDAAHT